MPGASGASSPLHQRSFHPSPAGAAPPAHFTDGAPGFLGKGLVKSLSSRCQPAAKPCQRYVPPPRRTQKEQSSAREVVTGPGSGGGGP